MLHIRQRDMTTKRQLIFYSALDSGAAEHMLSVACRWQQTLEVEELKRNSFHL